MQGCNGCPFLKRCYLPPRFSIFEEHYICPCINCLVIAKCTKRMTCYLRKTYRGRYTTCKEKKYLVDYLRVNE